MDTYIRKTVLTLTAFMSVNAAFANSLTPTPDAPAKNGVTAIQITNKDKRIVNTLPPTTEKSIANSLPPTFEGRAIVNTLPPSYEGRAIANTLPPSYEGRAIVNTLPPSYEGKALANSLPPTFDGRAICSQRVKLNVLDAQRVRMG